MANAVLLTDVSYDYMQELFTFLIFYITASKDGVVDSIIITFHFS